jgi:hypothetical protein
VGLKHSIKQWIPGISMAPFFHLSIFAGYTQLKTNVNLNFIPQDLQQYLQNVDPEIMMGSLNDNYQNQQMLLTFSSFTGDVLASFDLPILTIYAGVGFCYNSTNLKLNGTFPMAGNPQGTSNIVIDDQFAITNPINLSMSSVQGSATKPRVNAGLKFTLAVITLHVDYTLANYSVYTLGLGISFR